MRVFFLKCCLHYKMRVSVKVAISKSPSDSIWHETKPRFVTTLAIIRCMLLVFIVSAWKESLSWQSNSNLKIRKSRPEVFSWGLPIVTILSCYGHVMWGLYPHHDVGLIRQCYQALFCLQELVSLVQRTMLLRGYGRLSVIVPDTALPRDRLRQSDHPDRDATGGRIRFHSLWLGTWCMWSQPTPAERGWAPTWWWAWE